MAKRVAGAQLNHDNWDQEEEAEEQGRFKKASETEIAGRVIKKAARRRVNPVAATDASEQKSNAFASFGGFSAKPADTGNAFGFLQKGSSEPSTTSSGFSFGTIGGSDSGAAKPTFSFGSSAKAAASPESAASFSFGSSGASAIKPVASGFSFGSTSSGGSSEPLAKTGAFSFGSSVTSNTATIETNKSTFSFGSTSTATAVEPSKSTSFVFGSKPSGTSQPVIGSGFSFGASKTESVTTESKKENNEVKPVFGSPASNGNNAGESLLKPKPDSNGKAATGGASTTLGVKFGEASSDSGGGGGGGTATAFQFGSSSTTSGGSASAFKFGAATTTTTTQDAAEEKQQTSAAISFNACEKKDLVENSSSKFRVSGGPAATDAKSSTGPFSFGTSAAPGNKITTAAAVIPVFGEKSSDKQGAPKFGSSDSSSSPVTAGFPVMFSSGSTSEKKTDSASISASKQPVTAGFAFGLKSENSSNSNDSSSSKSSNLNSFGFSAKPAGSDTNMKKSEAVIGSRSESLTTVSKTLPGEDDVEYSSEYLSHLSALNKQVTQFIKNHIDDNALVILTPVFKDYDKHLADITEKYPPKKKSSTPSKLASTSPATKFPMPTSSPAVAAANTIKPFSFGGAASAGSNSLTETKTESVKPFSFGSNTTASPSITKPDTGGGIKPFSFGTSSGSEKAVLAPTTANTGAFSFGLAGSTPAVPGGGFSFGSGGMFSAPGGAAVAAAPAPAEQEAEYEPPKAEVKQVEETDALYSKKCKLFYKKDGNYVEKGVGMLHLKSADNGKTQLLIRADTNLGNILLNIILNKDIPTTRVGKNNVMLVCVPNPPINPKDSGNEPVGMLIRVKGSEDADELKTKLDTYKAK